jgi:Predicted hydrolases or acyltransferases (alpha/beta hydrolase superfamily)
MRTIPLIVALLLPLCSMGEENHEYQFATIAGNEIAWSCRGAGSPTIALIAGMGLDAHASFSRIHHNYDGTGRICMYDRAGMGKSTFPKARTRTLNELVEELHGVSIRADWGKLVLVAHSFGGFIARSYASKYHEETLGILLLDAPHEDWLPRLRAEMLPADWAIMERILAWNIRNFHEDYLEAQEAVRSTHVATSLPITVISRGIPHVQIRLEKMSYEGIELFDSEHNILQSQLARLSSNTQHRVARYSSHMINDFDPWLAVDEIKLLVGRLPN